MKYDFKGRTINIPDEEIEKNMKVLDISKDEAIEMWLDDNDYTENEVVEELTKKAKEVKRYEKAVDRLNKATTERESRMQRDRELRIFIGAIKEQPLILETWDEGLWLTLLETATVQADNRIIFRFKDGTDIEVGAE